MKITAPTKVDTFYVTFGVKYGIDEEHPLGMTGDGYVAVEAPDYEAARGIAHALFRHQWAFVYDRTPTPALYPRGEVLRIAWVTPDQRPTPEEES